MSSRSRLLFNRKDRIRERFVTRAHEGKRNVARPIIWWGEAPESLPA
jgi:hypothetical protein